MPDYKLDTEKCIEFLQTFTSDYDDSNATKYLDMLQEIANRTRRTLDIELDDITSYFTERDGEDIINGARKNTRRYQNIFADAADAAMPLATAVNTDEDVFDVLMRQREQSADAEQTANQQTVSEAAQQLPSILRRRFEVNFVPGQKDPVVKLRDVKAGYIGQLVVVKGICTRVGDVRPLMQVATYACDECGFEIYQEVTSQTFMPLDQCPSERCKTNKNAGQLHLHTRGSKFQKFQEVKIQEMAEDVPMGSIPRTLTVQVKGEHCRKLAPGDVVDLTGVFLPVPYTGFRAMRAGLVANVYLDTLGVRQHKKKYHEQVLTAETRERVEAYSEESDIYSKLARSLAPEIYGHEDVKKALLLMLVGGASRQLPDGMKLRGDIHFCLMGDPGVAKSQLLKYSCGLVPRAVYTTGRGSSGVGLTAAVMRDPVTNDMVLEGGALVLADMGICCIDEFDKMEESDRTAIHEVMEQQTVSIAKAGITTTLNARTSVLAAANPAYGRYDMRRSPEENIALPAALLSRFDLLWLILDKADEEADIALAQHVLHVHRHLAPPALDFDPLTSEDLRAYVATAKKYSPAIPPHLSEYIAAAYAELRSEEAEMDQPGTYTTARTLLSILRLGQALARLRFAADVVQGDIDEALRLMKMSKVSLTDDSNVKQKSQDPISQIYTMIRDYAQRQDLQEVPYAQALRLLAPKGLRKDMLDACLEEYCDLNVWQLDDEKNIIFIE